MSNAESQVRAFSNVQTRSSGSTRVLEDDVVPDETRGVLFASILAAIVSTRRVRVYPGKLVFFGPDFFVDLGEVLPSAGTLNR